MKIMLDIYEYRRELLRTTKRVALEEVDLRRLLASLDPCDNPMEADEIELRDYLDGRGQFATRVVMTGAQESIRTLLDQVAAQACMEHFEMETLSVQIVRPIEAESGDIKCHRAYTMA